MKETDHQTQIKLSVKRQGGYSFKLSNRFTIGIPDLLIALPPFVPCLAEVKDLGECVREFSRKLDVSPKQGHELKAINDAYISHRVAILLVTLHWQGEGQILVPLPHHCRQLTGEMLRGGKDTIYYTRQRGQDSAPPWYDMQAVLEGINVAKVKGTP